MGRPVADPARGDPALPSQVGSAPARGQEVYQETTGESGSGARFHYVQRVCLVPDWLVCASCSESGLLLKTFKINILALLQHSAAERFEKLAGVDQLQ